MRRGRGGIGSMILRAIMGIVILAFFVAFMRAMNWDPFGAVDWFWNTVIEPIAHMFSSNESFKEITSSP